MSETGQWNYFQEKWKNMSEALDILIAQGEARGRAYGEVQGIGKQARSTAVRMFKEGFSLEDISRLIDQSPSRVEEWIKER